MNETLGVVQKRIDTMTLVLAALMIHGRRGKQGTAPDFEWSSGMLSYIVHTARGRHFSNEENAVLRPLERLAPDLRPKIARARRNHVGSSGYCYRMTEALGHWQKGWSKAADAYLDNARDHFQLAKMHARLMRTIILPAAAKLLPDAHWKAAASEIARAPDPLSGCESRSDYETAFCALLGRSAPPMAPLTAARSAGGGLVVTSLD